MLTWRSLNLIASKLTEDETLIMLNEERAGRKRVVVLERLHQVYSAKRTARERIEILNEATNDKA